MPKDKKKEKKPRKPRAKKEKKKITQKQTQKQVVNIHLGARGRPRAAPTPKQSSLPQTIIRMNEPPIPLPLQPIPPMREPLKERTSPSKLVGLQTLSSLYPPPFAEATPYEPESSIDGGQQSARRGRKPLDPSVVKYRKELAEIEKAKKRMEREAMREAREAARPVPRPRGRPRKEGGAKEKEGAATESGYEN